MERHMRLSRAAVVLVAIALIAAIAAAVWFASPDAPYVPNEDSGAALGTAAPAEDGTVANQQTTVPSGYTGIYATTNFGSVRSGGRGTNGSSAKYILMEDITVTSIDTTGWGTDGNPWKGELDGNGHTITLSGTAEGEYYDNGGLFSVIGGGAYIHDLTVQVGNVRVNNNAGNANFGTIAGAASGNATIDNVYISLNKNSSSNGDTYLSSQGTSWLGGVLGKLDTSGTVEIKNTTVYNSAEGSNGFSATINKSNGVYVGGFVGSIDKGSLKMTNVVYKADANAKISAIAINSTGWFDDDNTTFVGGILGYHNEGSFELNGCIIDAAITLSSGFRTVNGDTAHAGYILGQVDSNLNDTWSSIYMNSSNGTTWLDGNNETRGTAVRYDKSVFADIRFADGEKVAVAVGKQSPANAGSIPRTITQGADTSKISDAEIAGAITEGSGTAWLTINKVNATTNVKMSVGDSVSTGNYNLTSPTISSVDGTTYKGSKEYDGTAYATPYITIGSKQINAWTADNTTADAGVKNFAYAGDSALTGYQVVSYANGDKYLVKDGTVYSPSTITIGGQSGQAFKLGNSFSYEITPASVTVTPSVPTDLYAGNPMPDITATAVDSGGSPVEGNIEWDEPNATLVSGKSSYAWTWTPNSSNYQTVKDSMELEAFDRKIVSLTVQGNYRKEYTAYEPFDPTGVEVIATYSDKTQAKLDDNKYEFTVVNGDINRLVVVNDTVTVSLKAGATVSTTFKIEVVKLTVDVPTEVAGLVYNGEEQIGVKNAEHYNLTGNTGTNAANYNATAELKDKDNTEWSTGGTDNVTIPWSIAPMTLDGTVSAPDSLKYDGNAKDAAFDLTTGTLFDPDQVTIVYDADDRTNVTGEAVTATAQLPSDNYKWATDAPSASFTIDPMPVEIGLADVSGKTYDGNVVDPNSLFIAPNGVNGEGALQLEFVITVDDENSNEILNAGTYTVTASLAESVTNYTAAQSAQATYEIAKVVLTGTLTFAGTATYDGTAKTATFILTSDNLVGEDSVGEVTYNEVDRINVTGQAIVASVALPSSGNYQWQDGVEPTASLTIVKATPAVTVKLSDDMPGNLTVAATLDNDWLVRTDNTGVEGTLAWDKAGELLQQGEVKYDWKFVPTDSNNYNNETGFLSITASEDTLQSITVKDGTYKTEYTAYEDFDPTGLVVIAHYASGAKVEVTSGFTLEKDKALTDGQITVTLNGVSTTITVMVNKREIPLPAATEGLIFNGEEQNGIDQEWIEQYAEFVKVDGNSQRDAGNYRATVTLTKDTNYVTWKGGSVDDETIEWTIAQMTLDGTVLAADRLEYDGNAKEATFNLTSGELYGDAVTIEYSGNNVNVTEAGFTATAVLPSGDNYAWADDTAPSATFKISPKAVEIESIQELTKTYDGEPVDPSSLFPAPNGVDGQPLELTVTVDGGATILNAGSYTVTAVLAQGQPNYTAKQAVAEYSVSKADPTVNPTADVQGALYTSDDLYEIALNLGEQDTPGTVSWDEGQRLTAGKQEYKWTFVPTDEVNYNGATGGIKLTAEQAQLVSVTVDVMPDTAYTAFDAFDPEGMVVTAHYPNDDTKQVALNDLSLTVDQGSIDRLVVASKTVTVSYSDGGVTKSDTITIEVLPLKVAAPTAKTDLVYNGAEQTGVEEGEHYTLSGDTTATNAGVYSATAKLKDKANTTRGRSASPSLPTRSSPTSLRWKRSLGKTPKSSLTSRRDTTLSTRANRPQMRPQNSRC